MMQVKIHFDTAKDEMLAARLKGYVYKTNIRATIGEQIVRVNSFAKVSHRGESRVVSAHKDSGLGDLIKHSILNIDAVNDDKAFKRYVLIKRATSTEGLHIINEFDDEKAALAALFILE